MKRFDTSFIIIITFFLIAAVFSWRMYFKEYAQKDTVNIHEFPKTIGNWRSEGILITDHEYDILETRNAFTRRYFNDKGDEVFLFIVYSQHNRKVSHPPEVCYTGSGATFVGNIPYTFKIDSTGQEITARRALVERGLHQQVMYYWFKVGDSFTSSYWKQQGLIALKTLLGQPASSALIRLTSNVVDENEKEAAKQIETFASQIMPLLPKYLP